MDTRFLRQPGDYDTEYVVLSRTGIGTLTGTGTTAIGIGSVPTNRKLVLEKIVLHTRTVPTSTGNILATFKKKNGGTSVSLNTPSVGTAASGDLESLAADVGTTLTFSTTNDADRIFAQGDCLVCDIAASAAIGTQPADLGFTAYFKILR